MPGNSKFPVPGLGKLNPGLPWQKQHSTRRIFHQKIGHKFKEETSELLYMVHSFVWCSNLDTLESRSKLPRKF